MVYVIIGCLVIIGILLYKLQQKQIIDGKELEAYNTKLLDTKAQ